MGYYLTNFDREEENRYKTAILLSGEALEIHQHPMPAWAGHSPRYDPAHCSGYYSLYGPSNAGDLSNFWAIFRQLEDQETQSQ